MAHHVYTTRGIILALRPTRESDKTVAVLTRDLGLVRATARGMRGGSSKLAPALLELALVKISLVRGKHSWRVTTVTLLRNFASGLRPRREALKALARVTSLLLKLVRGEEKHVELYDELESAALTLTDSEPPVDVWEVYTVARLLQELGYLREADTPKSLEDALGRKSELITLLNTSIKETGLS